MTCSQRINEWQDTNKYITLHDNSKKPWEIDDGDEIGCRSSRCENKKECA